MPNDENFVSLKQTNRQKLLSMSEYDLLCKMNDNIRIYNPKCVLDLISSYASNRCANYDECEDCIAKWLNETDWLNEEER